MYIEYTGVSRDIGNFREESDLRAKYLYSLNPKIMLGLSSGIDSQVVLQSLLDTGVPVEPIFMYTPGYNDNEYENIKFLEKKHGIKVSVVDIDPYKHKEELLAEAELTGIHPYQLLHKKLLSMLPDDYMFLQGMAGPFVLPRENNEFIYWESPQIHEVARHRAFALLNRPGKEYMWDRTSELVLSYINDDIISGYMHTIQYFLSNGLKYEDGGKISLLDHWDVYLKHMLFGLYWGDDITFFPKYMGPEKIDFLVNAEIKGLLDRYVRVPIEEFKTNLTLPKTTRYYQV
jgi:hypothetical protein